MRININETSHRNGFANLLFMQLGIKKIHFSKFNVSRLQFVFIQILSLKMLMVDFPKIDYFKSQQNVLSRASPKLQI